MFDFQRYPMQQQQSYFGVQPQVFQPPASAQPQMQLIRVNGLEGAKAYQMPPNSSVALFDEGEDILYVKSTDGAGFGTVRPFNFTPREETVAPAPSVPVGEFVTKKEFEEFKKEIIDHGKKPVKE